jgi:AsmA protein
MRKLGIVIGIIVLLVVVLIVAAVVLFNPNQYRGTVQTKLEAALGRKVTLGDMSLGIFPFRFQVQDIAIADDPAFNSLRPFVQASKLDVSVKLMPLLQKSVEVDSLTLEKPSVELIKNSQGVWNFSSLGGKSKPSSTSGTTSAGGQFALGKLEITDGQVAITDNQNRKPRSVYDHINLTLTDFAPATPFSIDASVHFPGAGTQEIRLQGKGGPVSQSNPAATPFHGGLDFKGVSIANFQKFLQTPALANTDGVLTGHTNIGSDTGKLSASGQMSIEQPRLHGIDVGYPINADYDVNDDLNNDLLKIDKATVKLGPTPLSVTGTVNSKPTPAVLDLNLKANDVSIAEMAKLAAAAGVAFNPGATVNGRVNADIRATGPSDKPALNGTIAGRDIQASGKDIPQPVQIKAVNLALTPTEIHSDNFQVTSGGTAVNTQFTLTQYTSKKPMIDATLKAPQAQLPALISMAKAYGVTGLDKVNGAGTLNLDMHAAGPLGAVSADELMRALNGTVNLNFNNVKYSGVDIAHELSSIGGFAKSAQKDQGFTNILKMTGNILVHNGMAQTNDLQALLDIGSVGATGTANLVSQTLNMNATAVLNKTFSQQVGGSGIGGYMNTALGNNQGEIVIPAIVTGTFQNPKFAPDVQKIAQMKLKGLLPTSGNPLSGGAAGILGGLLGGQKAGAGTQGQSNPQQDTVNQILDLFGKKKQPPKK